ncbi:MAG: AMIN domain-containing protein [Tissierellia bacterium]|nr:AMIN domain-containing protein [Tissierellia bacterium]
MKKWKVFLSLVFIFAFITSSVSMAQDYFSTFITVRYDGKNQQVRAVPVILDGQAVQFDVPSFIKNGATFVPIRFVTEKYGAEVTWDQKTKTATIINGNFEMALTIGSNQVYINGQRKTIDSSWIPKLVTFNYGTSKADSRTMVPLRLISETLGYEVGYDEESKLPFINTKTDKGEDEDRNTNKVVDVAVVEGSTQVPKVVISGTSEIKFSTLTLENPSRLVIDIEDAVLDIRDNISFKDGVGRINVDRGPIDSISISQFSKNPDITRVVLNLSEEADFDIVSKDDGKAITIHPVNRVKGIERDIVDGKEAIVINSSKKAEIRTMKLTNPTRMVIDLLDSSLEGGDYFNYDYNIGFVKRVRVSQFVPDNLYNPNDRIVRIVLDIADGVFNPEANIISHDDQIIIIPETSLQEVIEYRREGKEGLIGIKAEERTEYDVVYIENRRTMIVEVPAENLDIKEGYLNISDGLVNDITVTREDDYYRFEITFRRGIEYDILSRDKTRNIYIRVRRTEEIKPSDRIIVIDPGHGGQDPGAVQNGVREKDINLAVSLKLDEALRSKGYNTVLTRDSDTSVGLYDRPEIANSLQADLFISIHSNSNPNSSVQGIQVMYYSQDKARVPKEQTEDLAKIMMDEITKGTGAPNRGLLPRTNYVVVRDTEMPAVLIEIGFLTNKEEVAKLQDEAYQYLLVESIINGIERYFEKYD